MPAFNFQKQFAPSVESGEKRQTIRSPRKIRPEAGQAAHLYTGLRTKACRKLGEHEIKSVKPIIITQAGVGSMGDIVAIYSRDALDKFARADGFESWTAMRDWFDKTHGLPFEGDLIKW